MRQKIIIVAVMCSVGLRVSLAEAAEVIVYDGSVGNADPRAQGFDLEVPDGTLVTGLNPEGFDPASYLNLVHIDSSANTDFAYQLPIGGTTVDALEPVVGNDRYTYEIILEGANSAAYTSTWIGDFISGTNSGSLGFRDRFLMETNLGQPGGPGSGADRIRMVTSGITATIFGDSYFDVDPNWSLENDTTTLRLERTGHAFEVYINNKLQYSAIGNQSSITTTQLEIKDNGSPLTWYSLKSQKIADIASTSNDQIDYVRDRPFVISGLMDRTALSETDSDTYLDDFNATTGDNINSSDHILASGHGWEARGTQWTHWVSAGREGVDGEFSALELGVDNELDPAGDPNNIDDRYGYHIGGEPKTQAETDEVIATAAALKDFDPDGFVYVGLNTDATDAMEDQMMSNTNIDGVIGHKYVSNNSSYENLRHTRALGLLHNKPYFRLLRAFRDSQEDYVLTDSDYRFKAFASLTYGYTGIQWFVYNLENSQGMTPQFFDETETYAAADTTDGWDDVAALNQEIFYIGEQTKHLRSTDVRLHLGDDAPYGQPTGTADWSAGAGGDPYITSIDQFTNDDMDILVGFFEHWDTQDLYFMVQNTMRTHRDDDPNGSFSGVVEVKFDFSSVVDPNFDTDNIERVSRSTGLWESVGLTSLGNDLYSVNLSLAGGDADLFRYKLTGGGALMAGLAGDFNGDGEVDGDDLAQWEDHYGVNLDGSDFLAWQKDRTNPGTITSSEASAVPEPTAGILLLVGVCCISASHRFQKVAVN